MDLSADPRPLAGRWALDRRLVDHTLGQSGCFHGELLVTPTVAGLDWVESGTLTWAGHTAPAERALRLRPGSDGWEMTFADGRPFHPWRLDAELVHPCNADDYRGRISATTDRMRITWRVTGPRKDQEIHTRLRRTYP